MSLDDQFGMFIANNRINWRTSYPDPGSRPYNKTKDGTSYLIYTSFDFILATLYNNELYSKLDEVLSTTMNKMMEHSGSSDDLWCIYTQLQSIMFGTNFNDNFFVQNSVLNKPIQLMLDDKDLAAEFNRLQCDYCKPGISWYEMLCILYHNNNYTTPSRRDGGPPRCSSDLMAHNRSYFIHNSNNMLTNMDVFIVLQIIYYKIRAGTSVDPTENRDLFPAIFMTPISKWVDIIKKQDIHGITDVNYQLYVFLLKVLVIHVGKLIRDALHGCITKLINKIYENQKTNVVDIDIKSIQLMHQFDDSFMYKILLPSLPGSAFRI